MTLVSVAVLCFFRRRGELGVSRWRTIGAPLRAFVDIGAVLEPATARLDVLVRSCGTAPALEAVITGIALPGSSSPGGAASRFRFT